MSFKTLSRQTIFEGRIFQLENLTAELPDGRAATYQIVRHPGAVAMLPLDREGRILFVSQFRAAIGQMALEIPAGTLEAGEEIETCARRELQEEIGMDARQLRKLASIFLAPGYSSEVLHLFLASDLYPASLEGDADEYLHTRPIPTAEAYRMAQSGEIQDAKTLAALLLAKPYIC